MIDYKTVFGTYVQTIFYVLCTVKSLNIIVIGYFTITYAQLMIVFIKVVSVANIFPLATNKISNTNLENKVKMP